MSFQTTTRTERDSCHKSLHTRQLTKIQTEQLNRKPIQDAAANTTMGRIREALARWTRINNNNNINGDSRAGLEKEVLALQRTASAAKSGGSSASGREAAVAAAVAFSRGAIVLYDGVRAGEQGIDMVLVHDVLGDRVGSWTMSAPQMQMGDAYNPLAGGNTPAGRYCWPRDFVSQDIADVRVITWGWTFSVGRATSQHAEALLADVARVRAQHTQRPLVFVAHGLGGLIVKDALITAALSRIYGQHNELGNVYPRTVGCVFMGTVHQRAGKTTMGELMATAAMLGPKQPSAALLKQMREAGDSGTEQQNGAWLLISRDVKVVNLCADRPTLLRRASGAGDGGATLLAPLMLPKEAVAYDGFNVVKDDMRTDHQSMARFASREDPSYVQLISHLKKMSAQPTPAEMEAREMRNQQILDALYYDSMTEREAGLDTAHGHTCDWILGEGLKLRDFLLSNEHSLLWLSGRAGSGKSTLLKHLFRSPEVRQLLHNGWARDGDLLVTGFFLSESGSPIQKSYEGFLRTILYQICSQRRDLIYEAFPSFFDMPWPPPLRFTNTNNLNQAFYSLYGRLSQTLRLIIFLDGLEEYRTMERRDHYGPDELAISYADEGDAMWGQSNWMRDSLVESSRMVLSMAGKDTVKLCLTSRELDVFEDAFASVPRIRLQEHTVGAVAEYVQGRLQDAIPGLPDARSLCQHVARRSKGDLLWARLAIDMVMDCSLRSLRPTLDALPPQLGGIDGLYMFMMRKLRPEDQRRACLIFGLVLAAQQPAQLVTLALAEQSYVDAAAGRLFAHADKDTAHSLESVQRLTDAQLARLASSCLGLVLAEDLGGKRAVSPQPLDVDLMGPRIVFTHQTAKEWVGRSNVWRLLPGAEPADPIDIELASLGGCVRHLGLLATLRPLQAVHAWPQPRFRPSAWLLMANALRHAERLEAARLDSSRERLYVDLLDELDHACRHAWVAALKSETPFLADAEWYEKRLPNLCNKHWAGYEPMESGKPPKRRHFLVLAVQANLCRYVEAALRRIPVREDRRRCAQELLVTCVSPNGDGFGACGAMNGEYKDFHHDMPDPRILDVLFACGAEVGGGGGGTMIPAAGDGAGAAPMVPPDRVWLKALKTGRRYFCPNSITMSLLLEMGASRSLMTNRQRWVLCIKKLLHHGADPRVEVRVANVVKDSGDEMSETTGMRCVTAGDLIREYLGGEPEYAVELVELEGLLMGRRPSTQLHMPR